MHRLLLPLLLLTTPCFGQRATLDSIRTILEEGIAAGAFPGAQVLVWHKGKELLHLTAGYHTYRHLRPVRKNDVYDLASITKTSSALLVLMQQYGAGQLDLDAPLGRLFPVLDGTNKAGIPLRAALAHRAGLRPWVPYWQTTLRGHAATPGVPAGTPSGLTTTAFAGVPSAGTVAAAFLFNSPTISGYTGITGRRSTGPFGSRP